MVLKLAVTDRPQRTSIAKKSARSGIPTARAISRLYNTDWFSVEIIIRESVVRELVPRLIERGADGIIEYALNKVVGAADAFEPSQ